MVTARAKSKIKAALREEKRLLSKEGKAMLERKLNHLKIDASTQNINQIATYFKLHSTQELFYRIAMGNIDVKHLKDFYQEHGKIMHKSGGIKKADAPPSLEQMVTAARGKTDLLVIGENLQKIDYKLSPCCSPIPGDDVFGFITINEGIKIHRVNCPNAIQLLSNYAYRVVKAKWTSKELISFLAGIRITGIDEVGIVNNITKIISNELNVNMRSLNFDTNDGTFEGTVTVFVQDTNHLTELMKKLRKVDGVLTVNRMDAND